MMPLSSASESTILAPSSAVPGWTAEYAVPLGGPGHLLLATFEQAAIGIAHLTLNEEWISVNQRCCEITGYTREELLKFKVEDLTHPDDVPASLEFIRRIRAGELPEYKMEKRYVRKDGRVIWVNLTVSLVRSANGSPMYIVAFIEDITPRRQAQAEASRSLSLLRATLESTADGMLVVDLDGKILSFNQKMADMWEIPAEVFACGDDQRAINAALEKLVYPDEFMAKVIELYRNPEEASYDVLELKDGRTFERYSQPQRIDDVPVGRVWSFRDVTARRRAEEQAHALARELPSAPLLHLVEDLARRARLALPGSPAGPATVPARFDLTSRVQVLTLLLRSTVSRPRGPRRRTLSDAPLCSLKPAAFSVRRSIMKPRLRLWFGLPSPPSPTTAHSTLSKPRTDSSESAKRTPTPTRRSCSARLLLSRVAL